VREDVTVLLDVGDVLSPKTQAASIIIQIQIDYSDLDLEGHTSINYAFAAHLGQKF